MTDHHPASYGTQYDPRPTLGLLLAHLPAAAAHGPAREPQQPQQQAA